MDPISSLFESEIIEKFKLFKGFRSSEEDLRLLEIISSNLEEEAIVALEEIIHPAQIASVQERLDNASTEQELTEILSSVVPDDASRWALQKRLQAYLDNLAIESVLDQ